jgi:hypothetical protein
MLLILERIARGGSSQTAAMCVQDRRGQQSVMAGLARRGLVIGPRLTEAGKAECVRLGLLAAGPK